MFCLCSLRIKKCVKIFRVIGSGSEERKIELSKRNKVFKKKAGS